MISIPSLIDIDLGGASWKRKKFAGIPNDQRTGEAASSLVAHIFVTSDNFQPGLLRWRSIRLKIMRNANDIRQW
jgi:hypothetical protein